MGIAEEGAGDAPDRRAFLRSVPAFDPLPEATLAALAPRFQPDRRSAGQVVVEEGDPGDRIYVIVEGAAEVSIRAGKRSTLLGSVGPGALVGEIALLGPERRRSATVTARTELTLLALDGDDFADLLREHPDFADDLAAAAERMRQVQFLRRVSPLGDLSTETVRRLVARLGARRADTGEVLLSEGEPGDVCYLVRSGRVQVVHRTAGGVERELTILGEGALLGETSLLTGAPRNATARALEPTELFSLRREDLLAVASDATAAQKVLRDSIWLRSRPRRSPNVTLHERTTADGEPITILRHERRVAYLRLAPGERRLWELMDGDATVRDLTMAWWEAHQTLALQRIASLIASLAAGGFVEGLKLPAELSAQGERRAGWVVRVAQLARWRTSWERVDPFFERVYRHVGRVLFARPTQALLLAVALAGLAVFGLHASTASTAFRAMPAAMLLLFYPMYVVSIVLHELAHGLTTKHFGRAVRGAGIGWFWFGPMAFVDTSDMWLADRWPRIAVSLAGPWLNVLLGSLASLAALGSDGPLELLFWAFAAQSYVVALFNLNPALELDGYYVLIDLLDRPNLRRTAVRWVSRELAGALRRPRELWDHRVELIYGVASILWVVVSILLVLTLYRHLLADRVAQGLPQWVGAGVGWAVALAAAVPAALALSTDLRAGKAPPSR